MSAEAYIMKHGADAPAILSQMINVAVRENRYEDALVLERVRRQVVSKLEG